MRSFSFLSLSSTTISCALLVAACSGADPATTPPTKDTGSDVGGNDTGADTGDTGVDAPDDTKPIGFSTKLSEQTLYSDFAKRTIASDVLEFEPAFALWSDGSVKRRWIQLPAGTKIDTSDMDNWVFPVGTKFWKEFRSTDGAILLETRLIERTTETEYRMGSYVWKPDASEAIYTEAGGFNVNGTDHDVPSLVQCFGCHAAAPGKINGFQAIQLSKPPPGTNLTMLAERGLLSHPPPTGTQYPVPGSEVERQALGYLHANCGHCHTPGWESFGTTDQTLRLKVADRSVVDTTTYKTTIWQATMTFKDLPFRVEPGNVERSALALRMSHRSDSITMPPVGTEKLDDAGLAIVRNWILSLPKTPKPD